MEVRPVGTNAYATQLSSQSLVFSLILHPLQLSPLPFDFSLVRLDLLLLLLVNIFLTLKLIAD